VLSVVLCVRCECMQSAFVYALTWCSRLQCVTMLHDVHAATLQLFVAYYCGSSSRAIDRYTVQAVHPPAASTSGSAVGADDTGQRTAASTTSAANNACAVAAQSESASVTSSSSSGSVTAGTSGAMTNQTACANVGCASGGASIGSSTTQVSSYTSCSLYW
jgi:hypothetical protein